jgi:malonyl-CoA O-methyltransferase
MSAYEAAGCHTWAERDYNPNGLFEKVYLLSPLEKRETVQYGMHTIPTQPRELPERLRALGVDIVRAYGGYWACDMACGHKARGGGGVPVVVSVHDTNPAELHGAIRKADYVLCMSEAVRELVLRRFPDPERVWVLPNRFDAGEMRPLPPGTDFADLDALLPTPRRLVCVGRLSEQKNQDTLIRALALLGPEYGCVFVGRNDPAPLRALAGEIGVSGRCRFVETVRNDLLYRYYNWAHAVVTPSRWEGFGIVFVEALASGAVVVTSNIRPMSEYIEHERNGLLVDGPEDAEALAAMVRRACTDEELRKRLRAAGPPSVARFERREVDALEVAYYRRVLAERPIYRNRGKAIRGAVRLARGWAPRHTPRGKGVYLSSRAREPYPEVSGYFIPTLLDWGETRLAEQYARWLVQVQNADGSWNGPDAKGAPYTFDTGQILKGLTAIRGRLPEVETALLRGCQWLAERVGSDGAISTPSRDALVMANGRRVPDAFHLYTLPPLAEAAKSFARPDWSDAVARALGHYLADPHLTDFATLSHFHAYIVEGLVDLGQTAAAARAMDDIERRQRVDGSVPAWSDVDWVCSPGLAQYALVWLKLGRPEPARRAFAWLVAHQNRSGGFFGSYGDAADYFPNAEIAWAVKYFLDVARRLT